MILLDHPYQFFFAFFALSVALGAWLNHLFVGWRVKKLQSRIELLKAWK